MTGWIFDRPGKWKKEEISGPIPSVIEIPIVESPKKDDWKKSSFHRYFKWLLVLLLFLLLLWLLCCYIFKGYCFICDDKPIANDDSFSVQYSQVLTGSIIANDEESWDWFHHYELISETWSGTLEFNQDGSFLYKPTVNSNYEDTFLYNIVDEDWDKDSATVIILVNKETYIWIIPEDIVEDKYPKNDPTYVYTPISPINDKWDSGYIVEGPNPEIEDDSIIPSTPIKFPNPIVNVNCSDDKYNLWWHKENIN